MKLVGVTNISFDQDFVRNQLFLFDRLIVLDMETALTIRGDHSRDRERTSVELQYLAQKGLIERVPPIEHLIEEKVLPDAIVAKFTEFSRYSDTWQDFVRLVTRSEHLSQLYSFGHCNSEKEALNTINAAIALQLRAYTLMTNISKTDLFAFCSDGGLADFQDNRLEANTSAVSIILNRIPIIPDMPYDEIIDFKASPAVKRLHERLKLWIVKAGVNDHTAKQTLADVEQAILEYSQFTDLQAAKRRLLQMELVFKVPLEVIESFVRLAPSRAVGALLEVRRKQIELYESEFKAPGNQFAYIREIEQRFPRRRA